MPSTVSIAQSPDRAVFDNDIIPLDHLDDGEGGGYVDETPSRVYYRNRWRGIVSKCGALYQNNTGLLLVALAGAFASMMSALVKTLNSIDPPVPMLEVRSMAASLIPALTVRIQLIFVRMASVSLLVCTAR